MWISSKEYLNVRFKTCILSAALCASLSACGSGSPASDNQQASDLTDSLIEPEAGFGLPGSEAISTISDEDLSVAEALGLTVITSGDSDNSTEVDAAPDSQNLSASDLVTFTAEDAAFVAAAAAQQAEAAAAMAAAEAARAEAAAAEAVEAAEADAAAAAALEAAEAQAAAEAAAAAATQAAAAADEAAEAEMAAAEAALAEATAAATAAAEAAAAQAEEQAKAAAALAEAEAAEEAAEAEAATAVAAAAATAEALAAEAAAEEAAAIAAAAATAAEEAEETAEAEVAETLAAAAAVEAASAVVVAEEAGALQAAAAETAANEAATAAAEAQAAELALEEAQAAQDAAEAAALQEAALAEAAAEEAAAAAEAAASEALAAEAAASAAASKAAAEESAATAEAAAAQAAVEQPAAEQAAAEQAAAEQAAAEQAAAEQAAAEQAAAEQAAAEHAAAEQAAAEQAAAEQAAAEQAAAEQAVAEQPAAETTGSNNASGSVVEFLPDNVIGSRDGDVSKIFENIPVSTAQVNVQTTPIAASGGYVYTANIEHGPDGDSNGINLKTVVRKGRKNESGRWDWESIVIEDRTVHDAWHTSPSIAVDTHGYIHVVYNMHNFPWQYKRSVNPHDITQWEFLGQEISTSQLEAFKYQNKVSYPTHGSAAIPGNQITYPAFFYDNNNQIYLSNRFAARPARSFEQRTFSGGLSKYNVEERTWTSIGAEMPNESSDFKYDENSRNNAIALAGEMGWTVYHPRIVFDPSNNIGVFHYWRGGIAGEKLTRPCFYRQNENGSFETAEGQTLTLPVTSDKCGNMGISDSQVFYSVGNATADPSGTVSVVLAPDGGQARFILTYSEEKQQWEREDSPGAALEIFYDKSGNLWAATHKFKLYRRLAGESSWEKVYEDSTGNECYPKVRLNATGTVAYIHTQGCDLKTVSLFGVQLVPPGS